MERSVGVQASWKSESSPPTFCMDCIIKGAIMIELHPSNMVREDDRFLNRSWIPLIHTLRKWRRLPHNGKLPVAICRATAYHVGT
jgi:hypothetical protein